VSFFFWIFFLKFFFEIVADKYPVSFFFRVFFRGMGIFSQA
jgi:hypothetical protein